MSEVAGVFGVVRISQSAKDAFYQAHGRSFVSDYICQQEVRALASKHEVEVNQRQMSATPLSWLEFSMAEQKYKTLVQQFSCDVGDLMLVNYDSETSSLFYLHFFNRDWAYSLKTSVSLQTFLSTIADYKDTNNEDYICFSSNATHFSTAPLHCFWKLTQGKIEQFIEHDINALPPEIIKNINDSANKCYFDILDKHTQAAEESENGDFDETAMLNEMVILEKDLAKYAI
jgi:hypothetical protein